VLSQIRHRETSPVPYSLWMEKSVEAKLDDYYGTPKWRDRLVPYMTDVAGIDTHKNRPISDSYERDIFGAVWRTDRRPWHLEKAALEKPSFQGYSFPKAEDFFVPDLAETAEANRKARPHSFHMIRVSWGLFENSWRIVGFENALMYPITEPAFYSDLLDRLMELHLSHVEQCTGVQADAVILGDDWGDQRGVMLGPDRWRHFLKGRWARIYRAVHDQGKITMSHCCGSVEDIMEDIVEIGLDVLESVQPEPRGMNPYGLKKRWGDRITFFGCLGSQSTIPFGTPQQIRDEVKRLCRDMGKGGGYILHPAKELQPETPAENAAAVLEAFTDQR
jgi:uroporphyrinogen decarboxylase